MVLCHGYPSGAGGARAAASTFPELADRIAARDGLGRAGARLPGLRPLRRATSRSAAGSTTSAPPIDHLAKRVRRRGGVWLAGFGTGGALAICAGAEDERVRGVASLAAPADFDDWAGNPRRLLQHAREVGHRSRPAFPGRHRGLAARARGPSAAVRAAHRLAPRPLLLVHGSDDELVPPFDARVLADSHGEAELRMIAGRGPPTPPRPPRRRRAPRLARPPAPRDGPPPDHLAGQGEPSSRGASAHPGKSVDIG